MEAHDDGIEQHDGRILSIEEHRRVIENLARSEAWYRQIVEAAREGICVSDTQGRFSFVNRRMAELVGYEPGQMLGMHMSELMDADGGGRAEQLLARRRQGIAEGGEFKIRHRDGRELWVKFESSPIMDAAGEYAGTLAVVLDITERKLMEDRLRKSEAQLQEAQELAHIGSWEWDLRTGTTTRSLELCRIFGVSPERPGSEHLRGYELVHPDDRARLRAEMERATRERQPWAIEYRVLRSDGQRFVHARGEVVSDEAGKPIRMFGTAQDITDRRQAEARLVLADRMASVGTLAAGVAHEINSPLAYVISNLDLIAEEIREAYGGTSSDLLRNLKEMTAEARQGAERVRQIVRGLKTFSRADEDRRALLDVRRVLDLSINMAFTEMRYRARLVKDYQDIPAVEADEARLGQVFINLLVNAAHAIPEGQTDKNEIRVCTRTDSMGRAVIEVRDTGTGIAPETLGRIFDPFFTTKPVGIGTGLGLAICHGIVTALGGEIMVESETGKGSLFRVALPAGRMEQAADPPPARWTVKPPRPGRVLVVDDETLVGTTMRRVLRDHQVIVARTGKEALASIASGGTFDLILCDLMMPEMTGMDFHAALSETFPELLDRVIFTTGGVFSPSARAFLDRIPNERLEKPFEPQNLRSLVQRFLR